MKAAKYFLSELKAKRFTKRRFNEMREKYNRAAGLTVFLKHLHRLVSTAVN